MLWTMLLMFLFFWLLGLFNGYSLGGAIHLLPVIAIIAMVVQVENDCSAFGPGRVRLRRSKRGVFNRSGRILPRLALLPGEKVTRRTISSQPYKEE